MLVLPVQIPRRDDSAVLLNASEVELVILFYDESLVEQGPPVVNDSHKRRGHIGTKENRFKRIDAPQSRLRRDAPNSQVELLRNFEQLHHFAEPLRLVELPLLAAVRVQF